MKTEYFRALAIGTIFPKVFSTLDLLNKCGIWYECLGQEIRRDEYPELFNLIGEMFGSGDGKTTFNLPNTCNKNFQDAPKFIVSGFYIRCK